VVQVAEDYVPVSPRVRDRREFPPIDGRSRHIRRPSASAAAIWVPLLVVGCVILLPALSLAWMIRARPPQPQVIMVNEGGRAVILPQNMIDIPEAMKGGEK